MRSGVAQSGRQTASQVLEIPPAQLSKGRRLDQGTWYRTPEFVTIRYRAASSVAPITDIKRQEEVSRALWTRLAHYIPQRSTKEIFHVDMGIVFDQEVVYPDCFPCIDIICLNFEACTGISNELKEIQVHDDAGRVSLFKQSSCGGELPQDILPFAIFDTYATLGHSEHWDFSKFVAALEQLASKAGTLIGPVRMIHTTLGGPKGTKFERMIYGTIRLTSDSAQATYQELLRRTSCSFHWIGSITVNPSYEHLRCYKEWAAQYPDRAAAVEGREPKHPSTFMAKAESKAEAATSGSGTTKKRKVKEEQV